MTRKKLVSILHVQKDLQQIFTEELKINTCSPGFVFLFQGQKPISAIFLIEGTIEVLSGKNNTQISGTNILLLHEEYIKSKPVKYIIKISEGARICWVDRAMVKTILSSSKIKEMAIG